jgi:tRNA(Ile)-lysidine synthase
MIKIQGKIPREVGVAVSGGVDSMAILDFLSRNHQVTAYNFHHGTLYGDAALSVLEDYCDKKSIALRRGKIQNDKPKHKSWEEHWRDERYDWLKSIDHTVVTAHHLGDCVETYVFNMCHGTMGTIPYRHANIIRPFRLTSKDDMIEHCMRHSVPWLEDHSNKDTKYMRNHIRISLLPEVSRVNPGIHKVVKKMMMAEEI